MSKIINESFPNREWKINDVITASQMNKLEKFLGSDTEELMQARTGLSLSGARKQTWATLGNRLDSITRGLQTAVPEANLEAIDEISEGIAFLDYIMGIAGIGEEIAINATASDDGEAKLTPHYLEKTGKILVPLEEGETQPSDAPTGYKKVDGNQWKIIDAITLEAPYVNITNVNFISEKASSQNNSARAFLSVPSGEDESSMSRELNLVLPYFNVGQGNYSLASPGEVGSITLIQDANNQYYLEPNFVAPVPRIVLTKAPVIYDIDDDEDELTVEFLEYGENETIPTGLMPDNYIRKPLDKILQVGIPKLKFTASVTMVAPTTQGTVSIIDDTNPFRPILDFRIPSAKPFNIDTFCSYSDIVADNANPDALTSFPRGSFIIIKNTSSEDIASNTTNYVYYKKNAADTNYSEGNLERNFLFITNLSGIIPEFRMGTISLLEEIDGNNQKVTPTATINIDNILNPTLSLELPIIPVFGDINITPISELSQSNLAFSKNENTQNKINLSGSLAVIPEFKEEISISASQPNASYSGTLTKLNDETEDSGKYQLSLTIPRAPFISEFSIEYATSTSDTIAPDDSAEWSSTIPSFGYNELLQTYYYLWSRIKYIREAVQADEPQEDRTSYGTPIRVDSRFSELFTAINNANNATSIANTAAQVAQEAVNNLGVKKYFDYTILPNSWVGRTARIPIPNNIVLEEVANVNIVKIELEFYNSDYSEVMPLREAMPLYNKIQYQLDSSGNQILLSAGASGMNNLDPRYVRVYYQNIYLS